MLTAHQQRAHEAPGVEVREAGRALKVHSEVPHLVSLGGGRLSTAVTLHPLDQGRMTIGSGQEVDIAVQGTGVEAEHCYIENNNGVVTLFPMAEMTSVDGVRVMTPTRLTQGSMVCIGRSNYMRFNHPAEARLMRSALPNTRISMVPLNFYNVSIPGVENVDGVDRKPPVAPRRSPRDSWGDVSNSSSCSEDCWSGNNKITRPNSGYSNGTAIHHNGSAFASNVKTSAFNNVANGRQTPDSRSGTPSLMYEENRSLAERRLGPALAGINTSARETEYRILTTPSPAFNRNPSPGLRGNSYGGRCSTPTPRAVEHMREEATRRVSSPTPSFGSNCSLEELAARKEELEHKRKQAQVERVREQETEKNERARLEEILSMCADYERQVQLEKQCKSPGIPQNRIKTNGSLPRDKRLLSEDEIIAAEVFTFEQSPPPAAPPVSAPLLSPRALHSSTRSPYENVVLAAGGTAYPQSPRTRIRTIASKETTPIRDTFEVIENRLALANDYEFVSSLPRRSKPQHQSVQNNRPSTPQQLSVQINSRPSTPQQSVHKDNASAPQQHSPYMNVPSPKHVPSNGTTPNGQPTDATPNNRGRLILPLDLSPVDRLSEALEAMKSQRSSDRRRSVELRKESEGEKIDRGREEHSIEEAADNDAIRKENTSVMIVEYETLRKERGKLLAAMSGLKRNITEIEQQEEEMLRELEMERALVDGEWVAQREKLAQEQLRQKDLRRQLARLDQEVVRFSERELQRQAECEARLTAAEEKLNQAKLELSGCGDDADTQKLLTEKVRIHGELLEQEKKMFEDLEFRHLEEEADCLAGHEELQRELSGITQRLDSRQTRLSELESQRLEADHCAQLESQGLERGLINNLRQLEEVRNRLREIETKLAELSSQGLFNSHDSSPEASSDNDECARPSSAQSPEDIARISRVTQGAPLEFSTGSLGRKTLESLQTIERNRQIHLEQQGGAVIEQERKRVEALKRRVQDEARAQWAEEQRQRENNCYSLNSVGSDEASSDVATESASSDETVEKAAPPRTTVDGKLELRPSDSTPLRDSMRQKELELERSREETRPLTDGSDYEQQMSVSMRDRDKAARLQQQRPLTRYLPIRSDRLDLRLHIETAGHQVDLCTHVTLDATSCRGFLHKLGAKFHTWGKRWFVFDRTQRTLTYYSDRSEKKAKGGAYFQAIAEVYVDHLNSVKSPNPQLTFVVKTTERTYHLMAPSPEAMRIWVDVVFTGAEGYQEFEHGT